MLAAFNADDPITIQAISEKLKLSSRTVLREMPRINEWFEENDFKLVKKPRIGMYVDEDTDTADGENDDTQYDEDGNAITGDETEDTNTDDAEANTDADYDNSGDTSEDTSSDSGSSSSYSGSGSSVVDYATQFVGNPYVWGGTSLTNGADCSGFVQSVYANFGVSLPRTSYEQQNAGTEVSYADAQPGDLICYGGHVAIYMGNGQIVHASNSQDGIKISNDATYRTIVSVRRLV